MKDEKPSEFIERYTRTSESGGKYINAVDAINELYSRIIALQNAIKDIHTALGDYGVAGMEFDKRLAALEGLKKIDVISPDQAKIILNS